jgi:hypothetical protein
MKLLYRNYLYEAVSYEQTPAFKAWFGDSKVKDDEGQPLNVYHGSTHDFDTFDLKKTYVEAYVGGGFYFTANPYDASENYAGKGPDAENKISQIVDNVNSYYDTDIAEMLGITDEELDSAREDDTLDGLIKNYAEKKIMGENPVPNIMPVYLRMVNPFYIGDNFKQYFEYYIPFDEETGVEGEPEGDGVCLITNLTDDINELDLRDNAATLAKLMEELEPIDGFNSTQFFNAIKDCEALIDATDDNGDRIGPGNFFKDIILKCGFDGVIMDSSIFRNMPGAANNLHYIVYSPNQVKSIFNKNPTNDPSVTKE